MASASSAVIRLSYFEPDREARSSEMLIRGNDVTVGRDTVELLLHFHDPCISIHHVQLCLVPYGEKVYDGEQPLLSPLVYVHILSRNGAVLQTQPLRRCISRKLHRGDVRLINSGDVLILSKQVTMRIVMSHSESNDKAGARPHNARPSIVAR